MRSHLFQGFGPVTDPIFCFQRELGHGLLKLRQIKNRIIAKTLIASRGQGDPAFAGPFGLDPGAGRVIENQDTH